MLYRIKVLDYKGLNKGPIFMTMRVSHSIEDNDGTYWYLGDDHTYLHMSNEAHVSFIYKGNELSIEYAAPIDNFPHMRVQLNLLEIKR